MPRPEVKLEHPLEPPKMVHVNSRSPVFADARGPTDSCADHSQPAGSAKRVDFAGAGRINGAELDSGRVSTSGLPYGLPTPLDERIRPSADVMPHSRHGKCLRRSARLMCCTLIFCVVLGGVIFLEAILTATDNTSLLPPGSNASEPDGDTDSPRERKSVRSKLDMIVVTSWSALGLLLLTGHLARRYSRLLRALHLPASVVGGILGWFFFAVCDIFGAGYLMEDWFSIGWDVLPGFCTNIVFCCLFLGTPVPRAADVLASPRKEQVRKAHVARSPCFFWLGSFLVCLYALPSPRHTRPPSR
jgi:hypothetical protein